MRGGKPEADRHCLLPVIAWQPESLFLLAFRFPGKSLPVLTEMMLGYIGVRIALIF